MTFKEKEYIIIIAEKRSSLTHRCMVYKRNSFNNNMKDEDAAAQAEAEGQAQAEGEAKAQYEWEQDQEAQAQWENEQTGPEGDPEG